jgi:oligopeptidase B
MHWKVARAPALLSLMLLSACVHTLSNSPTTSEESAVPAKFEPQPPVAAVKPYTVKSPNGDRSDNYYWLRDDTRSNPEVLAHLQAETDYAETMLAHTKPAQELLYNEIVGRIKQDDATVPYRKDGYWYYMRFETGKEYPVHARRKGSLDAAEEVLLDTNALAEGKAFYQASGLMVSSDGTQLVYAEDVTGRRQFVLRFKNLATGQYWPESIGNVEARAVWAADNKTVLYIEKDPVTLLGKRVRRHTLGTDPKSDTLVYEEQDESYYMGVGRGRSGRFLYIGLSSTVSSEWRYADAADPKLEFKVIYPRERDHEYSVEDHDDEFVITSNWQAKNFRLLRTKIADAQDRSKWRDWLPHRDDALIENATVLKDFVAINERSGGLSKIRIKHWADGAEELISFDEPAYTAFVAATPEYDNDELRFVYTSMTTPPSTYDLNVKTGVRKLMKRDPVLGDFDPARYRTEFVFAPARDGTQIPVSLVYRADIRRDGKAPLYQYGYGSYGASMDPTFSATRLSLLDRGVVYAIAHIRGGEEMGRAWYENGRQLKKMNTFTDFIDVTDFLVAQGYAAKDRVVAQGGSAGGLLMGAIANLAPEKYRAIVADVPFVDVVTTMLDESIPLTTNEFDEWGNPKQKTFYDYMLSYSPYDNVRAQAYPAMLVTTGLHDSQVQYFEPAKWVAKLRTLKTDRNPLLFHINMEAGHGGKSGRFQRYREVAMDYGFLFDQLGIEVVPIEYAQKDGFEVSNAR